MTLSEALGCKKSAESTPDNPPDWLISAFWADAQALASGVRVNATTALNCAAVLAAVLVLSQDIAKLPLLIYRRLPNGGREVATDHELWPLLAYRPNPYQSRFTFREQSQAQLLLRGNCYLLKARDRKSKVAALIPVHPDRVTLMIGGGQPYYQVTRNGNRVEDYYLQAAPAVLSQEDVLHVPGLSLDGVGGVSVLHYARETIGLALATEQYGAKLFGQGARPSGTLTHPGKLSPESAGRLRDSWNSAYSGIANAGKVAVLEEGMKFEALALSNEDAQFLASRQFSVIEIARIFRLPPHKLMDLGRATWSNIEQMSLEYVTDSLMPWLERWEAALENGLLADDERDQYFIEHDISRLLRGDSTSRANYIKNMFYTGALSVNEVRSLEGRNPVVGGDRRYMPVNLAPLDEAGALSVNAANNSRPETPADSPTPLDAPNGPAGSDA